MNPVKIKQALQILLLVLFLFLISSSRQRTVESGRSSAKAELSLLKAKAIPAQACIQLFVRQTARAGFPASEPSFKSLCVYNKTMSLFLNKRLRSPLIKRSPACRELYYHLFSVSGEEFPLV